MPDDEWNALVADIVRPRFADACLGNLLPVLRQRFLAAKESESIYLWGPPGVGKSYAFAALARHFIIAGFNVRRITYEKLCLLIRDSFKSGSVQSEWGTIEPYLRCDKLFLEDISTTVSVGKQESDFALRVVLLILDSRSEDCLPTFITGNKPIEEIAKAFDARVASRLQQGLVYKMTGKDRRIQKHE